MADFQAYAFAAPPAFPTGAGVCAPPAVDGLIAWFSLDRTGEQVDASGFDHAAEAFDVAAVNATLPSYDYTRFGGMARTRHGVNGTAPCAAWSLYPGCAAPEPEEDSECLAAAGFDTGECGRKASGGIVSFADGFTIHTFTDVDAHATFAIDRDDLTRVEVLVVGGRRRRRFRQGRGRRRRRVKHRGQRNALEVVKGQTFDVVVGAGGAGVPPPTPREATAATARSREARIPSSARITSSSRRAARAVPLPTARVATAPRAPATPPPPTSRAPPDSPPCFPPRASPRRSRAAAGRVTSSIARRGARRVATATRRARTGRATRFPTRAAAAAASRWTTRAPEVGVAPTASSSCDTRDGALMECDGSRGSYSHSCAFTRPRRSRRVYE